MAVDLARSSVWSAARDTTALRSVLSTVTAQSCPRFYNFHIHTVCSDGKLQPEAVVQQAIDLGLQGFAITDHHSTAGYRKAQQWLEDWLWASPASCRRQAPMLWTGIEINAGLLDNEVHILAYAFNPDHPAMRVYQQGGGASGADYLAERVIQAIHAAGGLAVLAHPARYRRSPAELIPAAARMQIDGVEAFYAYTNPSPWYPSPAQTELVTAIGREHGLLSTCGTDSHGISLLQRL